MKVIAMKNVICLIVKFAKEIWILKDVINALLDWLYIVTQILIICMQKNVFFKTQEHKIVVEHIIMIKTRV